MKSIESDLSDDASISGPAALRVSQRANSFSATVGYSSTPIEIPTRFGAAARILSKNFGNVINEFK